MARKNVFSKTLRSALNDAPEDDSALDAAEQSERRPAAEDLPRKRSNPNVAVFRDSFQEQMLRSLQDVDPERIDSSRFKDRLNVSEDLEDLKASIQDNGQQVPVLLRKVGGDRYEVVYGRRRILACQQLGLQVRAMVVEISDEDAVIAQGLENAARLENSYIEKALFVAEISDAGYTSDTIRKALGIDKTQASKMRGVVRDIPREVITAIGAAHGVGRRPWEDLRKALSLDTAPDQARLLSMIDRDLPSPDRLKGLNAKLKQLSSARNAPPAPQVRLGNGDFQLNRTPRSLLVKAGRSAPEAFLRHLEDEMENIYQEWLKKNT